MANFRFLPEIFDHPDRLVQMYTKPLREFMRKFVVQTGTEVKARMEQVTSTDAVKPIITVQVSEPDANTVQADVISEVVEAKVSFLVTGARPHIIRGNPLSWRGPDGKQRFAQFVMHPGIPPAPVIRRTEDEVGRLRDSILVRAAQRAKQ